jgi:hypothetical protein
MLKRWNLSCSNRPVDAWCETFDRQIAPIYPKTAGRNCLGPVKISGRDKGIDVTPEVKTQNGGVE